MTHTHTNIQITIPGAPVAWARPGQNGSTRYTPDAQRAYGRAVSLLARRAMAGQPPFTGPVAALVEVVMGVPASWPKRDRTAALAGERMPISRPDWDNLGKIVCDAMNGIVYVDDAQIVDARVLKRYGEVPRVDVAVSGSRS